MAKTITLTVQVDDSQYQKFVRDYTAFANQIQNLNVKFNAINTSIAKAKQSSIDWLGVLRGASNVLTGIVPMAERVTKNIAKWSALIGGISLMLGTGAGLFGIERLANSLIQRRRQMMGIGGDWGRIQGMQAATQATFGDPLSVMQRIRMGQMGDQPARRGMLAAGISLADQQKMKPSEIYEQIIKNIPDIIKTLPKGQEMPALKQRFLTEILPMEDWQRLIKPEGGLDVDEHQRILKRIQEEKDRPSLTPEAGRSWADLYEAARSFVTQIQTSLGNSLSGIATSLTDVSKNFTKLLEALLDTPAVQKALSQLKAWLDSFAETLGKDETKKKLEEWMEKMEGIPWAKLGEVIGTFIEHLGTVIRTLLALKGAATGAVVGGALAGPWGALAGGLIGGGLGWYSPEILGYGLNNMFGSPTQNFMNNRVRDPRYPNGAVYFTPQMGPLGSDRWNWMGVPPPTFPVNPMNPNATSPPAATGATGKQSSVISGTSFAQSNAGGNRAFAMMGTGGRNLFNPSGNTISNWSHVAQGAVPANQGGALSSMFAMNNTNFGGGGRGGRGRGGPLDIDNWQMNRTAQLRIDSVAGANIYHTGVAMA